MLPGGQDNCFTMTGIHHSCPSPEFNPRHKVTGRASSSPRVSKASCLGLQKPLPSLPISWGVLGEGILPVMSVGPPLSQAPCPYLPAAQGKGHGLANGDHSPPPIAV